MSRIAKVINLYMRPEVDPVAKMEFVVTRIDSWHPLTNVTESFILDTVWDLYPNNYLQARCKKLL